MVDIHSNRIHHILSFAKSVGIKRDPTLGCLETDRVIAGVVTLCSPKPDVIFTDESFINDVAATGNNQIEVVTLFTVQHIIRIDRRPGSGR